MTRPKHPGARSAAIDGRTRKRRIANLRARQIFGHQPEAQRQARMTWLAQLAGAIETSAFTPSELMDARAALAESNTRQQQLDLKADRDASR